MSMYTVSNPHLGDILVYEIHSGEKCFGVFASRQYKGGHWAWVIPILRTAEWPSSAYPVGTACVFKPGRSQWRRPRPGEWPPETVGW